MVGPMSVAEAAGLLEATRSGLSDDDPGVPGAESLLIIDVDRVEPGADLRPPAGWPCVVVAVSTAASAPRAPAGPDLLLTEAIDPPAPWVSAPGGVGAACQALEQTVRRSPQAATILVGVLRVSVELDPAAALMVESLAYAALQAGSEHRVWLDALRTRAPEERRRPAVEVKRHENTLWVMLDRAERRNAYSARMRDELFAALQLAGADPSIDAVHLAGRGSNFCSGGDLAEFGDLSDPATAHGIRMQRNPGLRISQLSSRTTAHLHGACVGAGVELAAFAGTVMATGDATLWLPEVGMGLIPGAGGTVSLPRRIGAPRTAWLALSGSVIDAVTAARWGLVDRLVDP